MAMRSAIRMNIAPPTMPPSSGVVRPLFDPEDAACFGIGVADWVSWILTATVVGVAVGSPGIVSVVIVVVIVCGFELPSVVVTVSVTSKVTMLVA